MHRMTAAGIASGSDALRRACCGSGLVWLAASALLIASSAAAQSVPPQIPPIGTQPGRIEQELARPPQPRSEPPAREPEAPVSAAPSAPSSARFPLRRS
jgi:hypothetical protein